MKRIKLIAGIVIIFLLGGLAGASVMRFYGWQRFGDNPRPRPGSVQRVEFIMERLKDDLDLTAAQMKEIRPIVAKGDQEVAVLKKTIRPAIRQIHDRGFAAIRGKLDPGQQRKLDELLARLRKFHKKPDK